MRFFQSSACDYVPRHQLGIMLLRGVAGIGLMSYAFTQLHSGLLSAYLMLAVSIVLLKGCPTCWSMHLVNLLRAQKQTPVDSPVPEKKMTHKKIYQPKDLSAHLFPPGETFGRERDKPITRPAELEGPSG